MALQALVVCPHAIGNVDHCRDGVNCLVPEFTVDGVVEGVKTMHGLTAMKQRAFKRAGLETAEKHDLIQERRAILELAGRAQEIWAQQELFLPSATVPSERGFFRKLISLLGGKT